MLFVSSRPLQAEIKLRPGVEALLIGRGGFPESESIGLEGMVVLHVVAHLYQPLGIGYALEQRPASAIKLSPRG